MESHDEGGEGVGVDESGNDVCRPSVPHHVPASRPAAVLGPEDGYRSFAGKLAR